VTVTLAIDVGATNARVAIVDTIHGRVEPKATMLITRRTSHELLVDCRRLAGEVLGDLRPGVAGVSVCETVTVDGEITSHSTLDWTKDAVEAAFADLAPVTIESDVVAAGLAEHHFGIAQGLPSFLMVNVGSGVSSSLLLDGKPWRGQHGAALLIGEEPIGAERLGSGKAIAARAGLPDGASVLRAAEQGDQQCAEICDSGATAVGQAIGFAINLLDPAAVIVSGGVVRQSRRFRDVLVDTALAAVGRVEGRSTPIQFSNLGDDSALLGVALSAQRAVSA